MGTENTNDDVIILADAYDTTDHLLLVLLAIKKFLLKLCEVGCV